MSITFLSILWLFDCSWLLFSALIDNEDKYSRHVLYEHALIFLNEYVYYCKTFSPSNTPVIDVKISLFRFFTVEIKPRIFVCLLIPSQLWNKSETLSFVFSRRRSLSAADFQADIPFNNIPDSIMEYTSATLLAYSSICYIQNTPQIRQVPL